MTKKTTPGSPLAALCSPWLLPLAGLLLVVNAAFIDGATAALAAPDEAPEELPAEVGPEPAETAITNERIKTLDGSKSAWSGQFQSTYSGSTLNHPFSAQAPNPGHFTPPPVVLMTGTFALRYRFDPKTTAGIGTGIGTETPLQGPKNTRASDPYIDAAHTFTLGRLHYRVALSYKEWTNHQYRDTYGYREGYSLFTDSYMEFFDKLTLGLTFDAFRNTFAAGDYNQSQQVESQFYVDPVLEYRINRTFNVRTVMCVTYAHMRNMTNPGLYAHAQDFQMLGLGIAATEGLYFYLYVKAFPYTSQPVRDDNTLLGLNMIINLF